MNVTQPGNSASQRVKEGISTKLYICDVLSAICSDMRLDDSLTNYLLERTRSEGFHFVCELLPKFASEVLRAIELGGYYYLRKSKIACHINVSRGSPFRVLLRRIFSRIGEPYVNQSAAEALMQLLQICELFKKLELQNGTKVNYESALGFVQKNNELRDLPDLSVSEIDLAQHIVSRAFPTKQNNQHIFFHQANVGDGPGTFSRELKQQSHGTFVPCAALKRGLANNLFRSGHKQFKKWILDRYPEGASFDDNSRPISELLLVPKSATKARAIVREPQSNLRLQRPYFYGRSTFLRSHTKGRINVFSQDFNRHRAFEASISKEDVTLDFSNASNSIVYKDIRAIYSKSACHRDLYQNCRTTRVFVPINWTAKRDIDSGLRASFSELGLDASRDTLFSISRFFDVLSLGQMIDLARTFPLTRYTFTLLRNICDPTEQKVLDLYGYEPYDKKEMMRQAKLKRLHFELVDELRHHGTLTIYGNRLGYIVPLEMLSGMGSYLTFPHMMEYFHTLLVMSVVKDRFTGNDYSFDPDPLKTAMLRRNRTNLNAIIDEVCQSASWLGDDGIFSAKYYASYVDYVATRGIKVNVSKTYCNSHFRESCGPYYYNGIEITPQRCSLPVSLGPGYAILDGTPAILTKLAALTRNLMDNGFPKTSKVFRRLLHKSTPGIRYSGLLSDGHSFGGYETVPKPKRVGFHNVTDEDKWAMYWHGSRYVLTTYGESLFETNKLSDVTCTRESILNWALETHNVVVYAYDPLPTATVPHSFQLSIKRSEYDSDTISRLQEAKEVRKMACEAVVHFVAAYAEVFADYFVNDHLDFA
jgi:hypothetical protein